MNSAKMVVHVTATTGVATQRGASNITSGNRAVQTTGLQTALAGGLSGAVATIVGHPFDTIKVILFFLLNFLFFSENFAIT